MSEQERAAIEAIRGGYAAGLGWSMRIERGTLVSRDHGYQRAEGSAKNEADLLRAARLVLAVYGKAPSKPRSMA